MINNFTFIKQGDRISGGSWMHPDKAWVILLPCLLSPLSCQIRGRVGLHLEAEYLVSSESMPCCHHGGSMPQLFLKLWSWLALAKVFLQGSDNCGLRYLIPTSTLRHPSQCYGNAAAFRRAGVTWLFFLVTECLIKIAL